MAGSPPRVRGKVIDTVMPVNGKGITPACAGKRCTQDMLTAGCWDHPRVCGEKKSETVLMSTPTGSPPRVRGKG